jgi:hypothetical protein
MEFSNPHVAIPEVDNKGLYCSLIMKLSYVVTYKEKQHSLPVLNIEDGYAMPPKTVGWNHIVSLL